MKTLKSLGGRLLLATSALLLIAATENPQPPVETTTEAAPAAAIVKPAAGNLPASFQPSPALQPIITLAQSGVSETILMAYINNQGIRVALTAEEIVFLRDLGISDEVITTLMLKPDGQPTVLASTLPPAPPVATPMTAVTNPTAAVGAVPPAPAGVTPVNVEQPAQVVNTNQFVDALAPYGNWVQVSGYGLAWQPTVVVINRSWRPYADCGRWVWSNCGWYWASDYSWGWAPFHYGRWVSHSTLNWVWVPDTCWGPSWVSWRYSPSYCGWAPLPPAACYRPGFGFSYYNRSVGVSFEFGLGSSSYCFVPTPQFCAPRPRHHVMPFERNTAIYHSTTVVNNYQTENNTIVINRGIGRDVIASAAPARVPEVEIRSARNNRSGNTVPGRIQRTETGRQVVYRPESIDAGINGVPQRNLAGISPAPSDGPRSMPASTPPAASTTAPRNLFHAEAAGRTPAINRNLITRSNPTTATTTPAPPSSLPAPAASATAPSAPGRDRGDGRPGRGPQINGQMPNPVVSTPPAATEAPTAPTRDVETRRAIVAPAAGAGRSLAISQPPNRTLQPAPAINRPAMQAAPTISTAPSATPSAVPQRIFPSPQVIATPAITANPAPRVNAPAPTTTPAAPATAVPALPQRYGSPPSSLSSGARLAQQQPFAERYVRPSTPAPTQAHAEMIARARAAQAQPSQQVPNGVKPSVINSVPVGVRPSVINTIPTGVPPSVNNSAPVGVRPSVINSVPTGVPPSVGGSDNYGGGRPAGPGYNRGSGGGGQRGGDRGGQ